MELTVAKDLPLTLKNSEIKHFSHWDQKPSQYFYLEIISSYALACPLTLNWL